MSIKNKTPICAYWKFDQSYSKMGVYYNWFAVSDSLNQIAPEGYHVASGEDWNNLKEKLTSSTNSQVEGFMHVDGNTFDDLVQESCVGLLKAVDRFNPDLGFKFSTYACWWIKQATLQYINNANYSVKIPSHSKMLVSKIRNTTREIKNNFGYTPDPDELSEILGVKLSAIENALKISYKTISFDNDEREDSVSLKEKIKDDSLTPEESFLNKELINIVKESLSLLTEREEKIIRLRFGIGEKEDAVNFLINKEEYNQIKSQEK